MYKFITNNTVFTQDTIPANTYALLGYQDENDKGLLTVHVPEGLTPLIDENGKQYRLPEHAGKSFNGVKWYNQ